jgi:hypothetical protein
MITKRYKEDEDRVFTVTEVGDYEFVNPVEKYREIVVSTTVNMHVDAGRLMVKSYNLPVERAEEIAFRVGIKAAIKDWQNDYARMMSVEVPDGLFQLFGAAKKIQIKILKGLKLTSGQFRAFTLKAFLEHGYTLSCYTGSHPQTGLDVAKMPALAYKEDDGQITTIGETELTAGQIGQAIEHRKVTVSKFFDKGDDWHCFFFTYNSINGKEAGIHGATPHMHYISSRWTLAREFVVQQLKSKDYSLPGLPHVPYDRN